MRRHCAFCLAAVLLATVLGCASTDRSESSSDPAIGKTTYAEAVKSMRRPPTSVRTTAGRDLVATWITEVSGGQKHLVLTFGPDRVLKDYREETR